MGQVQYLSAEGLEKLKQELHELKTVKRREIASRLESAKALGDISENAEYTEAKDMQVLVEGRIVEIEEILKDAVVIEQQKGTSGAVHVGSTVDVMVKDKKKTFTIVGSNEADPLSGKISNESPIGSALLGAKVGDEVDVQSPAGNMTYEILAIR